MKDLGLVSIIMPCYNGAKFIAESIRSVQCQTYQNWELLIQDDGSTDESIRVAIEYAMYDNRIKIECNERNRGVALTRNNAIRRSIGHWVAFLDCDDIWMPEKLATQLNWMDENNVDFSFTEYELFSENGTFLGVRANVKKEITYKQLMLHCWPGCLTVMYRQDVKYKIYCDNICNNEDHALFLRVVKHFGKANGIPQCLSLYRIRKGSFSRNKIKLIGPYFSTIHKLEGKNCIFSSICVFTHVIIKTLCKYRKQKKIE